MLGVGRFFGSSWHAGQSDVLGGGPLVKALVGEGGSHELMLPKASKLIGSSVSSVVASFLSANTGLCL